MCHQPSFNVLARSTMAPKNIRTRKAVSLEDDDEEPVDIAYAMQ